MWYYLRHSTEKTLYVAGDTIWYDGVKEEIDTHKLEVIVLNAGRNKFIDYNPVIMEKITSTIKNK